MLARRSWISLGIILSSTIVISMALLAAVIIGNSFFSSRAAQISSAETTAQHIADSIDLKIESFTHPITNNLQLLELDPLAQALTYKQRLQRLPVLVQTLKSNPILSAVYVGYPNGDFFLLRSLKQHALSKQVEAPSGSVYLLQSIQRDLNGTVEGSNWSFYSEEVQLLEMRDGMDRKFDPRERPWFLKAKLEDSLIYTSPYVFFTTEEIGLTMAIEHKASGAVFGADASIHDLSMLLKSLQPSPAHHLALVDTESHTVAYPDPAQIIQPDKDGQHRLASLEDLGIPALSILLEDSKIGMHITEFVSNAASWYGSKLPVGDPGAGLQLVYAVSENELLRVTNQRLAQQLSWSLGLMLILLFIGAYVGRLIARPLLRLTEEVRAIARFDFKKQVIVDSPIREVQHLARLISALASGIDNFKAIAYTLSRERDLNKMIGQVTHHLIQITAASKGVVYRYDAENQFIELTASPHQGLPEKIVTADMGLNEILQMVKGIAEKQSGTAFITPLLDKDTDLLGILILFFEGKDPTRMQHFSGFVEEVSGAAATAIKVRKQSEEQEALIDAIIYLLADAIDAKSPYTSGHCERVPELAALMVSAAEKSEDSPFRGFQMSEQEKREFRIASWLHDCGKITSPEYIVDKATKLETINNRIHEIRTRFEVLWRDAEIVYWQGRYEGKPDDELAEQLMQRQTQLQQDFEVIACANVGGEFMSDADIEKLELIGQQQWVRHFDDRVGISSDESSLHSSPPKVLPCQESLLRDAEEHIVPWGDHLSPVEKGDPDNEWGFDMALPAQRLNRGELYNLCIRKGTLNDEERFAVNDHIVQTIKMLSSLPLPKDLKKVPDIAGNHHEKMDGTGYPRKLDGQDLSIPDRIMVLADIFEALTASDRPYKEPKTLSEAIKILAFMVKDNHVDGQVFELFLTSKVYLEYADKYLSDEQIDEVDVSGMLALADVEVSYEVQG